MAVNIKEHSLTETSVNTSANTSTVRYRVVLTTTSTSHNDNNITTTYSIGGTSYTSVHKLPSKSDTVIIDKSVTIGHDTNGYGSVGASFSCPTGISAGTITGSTALTLTPIPRNFTQQPYIVCTSLTETTFTFNWSTSEPCNYIMYRINGSAWANLFDFSSNPQTSGQYTFSGLSPNTQYSIQISCRRADSNLWSESNVETKTTYPYPTLTGVSTNNLIMGQSVTVSINNPLNRPVTVYCIKGLVNQQEGVMAQNSTSSNSVVLTPDAETLYNSMVKDRTIQNNGVGTCFYYLEYGTWGSVLSGYRNFTVIYPQGQVEFKRPNTVGSTIESQNISGTFYNNKIGSTQNTISFKYRYKQGSGEYSSWKTLSLTTNGNSWSYSGKETLTGMDYKEICYIDVVISDSKVDNAFTVQVLKGQPVWYWNEHSLYVNGADVSNTYSTDEIRIGTWIDGKPIYKKSYQFTSSDGKTIGSINGLDNVISIKGITKLSGDWRPIPVNADGDTYNLLVYVNSQGEVKNRTSRLSNQQCHITIEYTKTTD